MNVTLRTLVCVGILLGLIGMLSACKTDGLEPSFSVHTTEDGRVIFGAELKASKQPEPEPVTE